MNTNPRITENNAAMKLPDGQELIIADDYHAKEGDTVIDFDVDGKEVEGVLRFSMWAWIVSWSDGLETIVIDPTLLKIKK